MQAATLDVVPMIQVMHRHTTPPKTGRGHGVGGDLFSNRHKSFANTGIQKFTEDQGDISSMK